ncbi:hypothetical protein EJB05_41293, partial [Eragrostis curvula]
MASQIESHRSGADVVKGDAVCRKKSIELLEELGLPKGLLPVEDIQEFGYNRDSGFMWLVQGKKKVEHTFKKIKQTVSYAAEVTAFVEKGKLRKITGVKTKELMLWLSVVVYVPEASPEKVTFKTGTGLSDSFDGTAFALGELFCRGLRCRVATTATVSALAQPQWGCPVHELEVEVDGITGAAVEILVLVGVAQEVDEAAAIVRRRRSRPSSAVNARRSSASAANRSGW